MVPPLLMVLDLVEGGLVCPTLEDSLLRFLVLGVGLLDGLLDGTVVWVVDWVLGVGGLDEGEEMVGLGGASGLVLLRREFLLVRVLVIPSSGGGVELREEKIRELNED